MSVKSLACSIAMAAMVTSGAMAQEAFTWTGAYVGVQAGYGLGSTDKNYPAVNGLFNGAFRTDIPFDYNLDGFLGGIYAGYNYQVGDSVILGVDADLGFNKVAGDITDFEDGSREFQTRFKWSGAARARVGYAMDRFMPYLAGGFAFGKYEDAFERAVANYRVGDSKTAVGWTLGAGTDYAFQNNLILRAEYRYTDFGTDTLRIPDFVLPYSSSVEVHDVRLGISYKF